MPQDKAEILVTGATGRIGSVLRRYWPEVSAAWQSRDPRPGFQCFDPLDGPRVYRQAAPNARTILCLAGVVQSRGEIAGFDANVDLALAAVRAGAETGARVLLASSAAVYGRTPGRLREEMPLRPVSEYGQSKARMEERAGQLGQRLGAAVTSLRIGNIAGLDAILGGWAPGFELDRFPDGTTPRRSYIGVRTLADVLQGLASTDFAPVVNIAQPGPVEMGHLLDAADLDWRARPAPDHAIPSVDLDIGVLRSLGPHMMRAADPVEMVAQWREFGKGSGQ